MNVNTSLPLPAATPAPGGSSAPSALVGSISDGAGPGCAPAGPAADGAPPADRTFLASLLAALSPVGMDAALQASLRPGVDSGEAVAPPAGEKPERWPAEDPGPESGVPAATASLGLAATTALVSSGIPAMSSGIPAPIGPRETAGGVAPVSVQLASQPPAHAGGPGAAVAGPRAVPQPVGTSQPLPAAAARQPDPAQVAGTPQAGPQQDEPHASGSRPASTGSASNGVKGAKKESHDEPQVPSGSGPVAGAAAQGPAFANPRAPSADVNMGSQETAAPAASSGRPAPRAVQAAVVPGPRTSAPAPVSDDAEADRTVQTSRTGDRPAPLRHAAADASSEQPQPPAGSGPSAEAATHAAPAHDGVTRPQSSDQVPQTQAARRVLEVVDRMGGDTAPKRMLVDLPQLGGMRLEVSLRGESVHLSVVEQGSQGDLVSFGREVAAGLADKGFDLTGFGSRGGSQQGTGSWADDRRQGPPPGGSGWAQPPRRRAPSSPMLHI